MGWGEHTCRVYECFWSLGQLVVETLGVAFVRLFERPFVTMFLGNCSSDFSEILYEVRVQKVRKNVQSAFLIIITVLAMLAKNCPNFTFFAQNEEKWIFWIFFKNRASYFPNFVLEL